MALGEQPFGSRDLGHYITRGTFTSDIFVLLLLVLFQIIKITLKITMKAEISLKVVGIKIRLIN